MSALETTSLERRQEPRLRPASAISMSIGRGRGMIADLSRGGARVRHTLPVRRGAQVRVAFRWQDEQFEATAEVLASRVASLGAGGGTMYESRLRFAQMTAAAREVLARVLTALANRDLRRWVANLHGWSDETTAPHEAKQDGSFLRCRLVGRMWKKKWTHDRTQPEDGFLLPGTVNADELSTLCDAFENADEDGRHLIRLMAEAVVREAASPQAA
ncbi:MAG TPA: PilZ domain-containing protein [Thermoanaerobaculia bacterium]|nr:PilZ domain-containing protein [Thermoanaerobaculia bacterium]